MPRNLLQDKIAKIFEKIKEDVFNEKYLNVNQCIDFEDPFAYKMYEGKNYSKDDFETSEKLEKMPAFKEGNKISFSSAVNYGLVFKEDRLENIALQLFYDTRFQTKVKVNPNPEHRKAFVKYSQDLIKECEKVRDAANFWDERIYLVNSVTKYNLILLNYIVDYLKMQHVVKKSMDKFVQKISEYRNSLKAFKGIVGMAYDNQSLVMQKALDMRAYNEMEEKLKETEVPELDEILKNYLPIQYQNEDPLTYTVFKRNEQSAGVLEATNRQFQTFNAFFQDSSLIRYLNTIDSSTVQGKNAARAFDLIKKIDETYMAKDKTYCEKLADIHNAFSNTSKLCHSDRQSAAFFKPIIEYTNNFEQSERNSYYGHDAAKSIGAKSVFMRLEQIEEEYKKIIDLADKWYARLIGVTSAHKDAAKTNQKIISNIIDSNDPVPVDLTALGINNRVETRWNRFISLFNSDIDNIRLSSVLSHFTKEIERYQNATKEQTATVPRSVVPRV